eukprot:s151_g32.t1
MIEYDRVILSLKTSRDILVHVVPSDSPTHPGSHEKSPGSMSCRTLSEGIYWCFILWLSLRVVSGQVLEADDECGSEACALNALQQRVQQKVEDAENFTTPFRMLKNSLSGRCLAIAGPGVVGDPLMLLVGYFLDFVFVVGYGYFLDFVFAALVTVRLVDVRNINLGVSECKTFADVKASLPSNFGVMCAFTLVRKLPLNIVSDDELVKTVLKRCSNFTTIMDYWASYYISLEVSKGEHAVLDRDAPASSTAEPCDDSDSESEADLRTIGEYAENLEKENQALRLVIASGLGYAIPDTVDEIEQNIENIKAVLNIHTEKLLELKNAVTREMPLPERWQDFTVKNFKEEALEFLGNKKTKTCYKKYQFVVSDRTMDNNRERVSLNYPIRGRTIEVRPVGVGGARPKTIKNQHTVKDKTVKAKTKADELNAELSKSYNKETAEDDVKVVASKVEWFVTKSLSGVQGAQDAFAEVLNSLDVARLGKLIELSKEDGVNDTRLKSMTPCLFGKEGQEISRKHELYGSMLNTASAYVEAASDNAKPPEDKVGYFLHFVFAVGYFLDCVFAVSYFLDFVFAVPWLGVFVENVRDCGAQISRLQQFRLAEGHLVTLGEGEVPLCVLLDGDKLNLVDCEKDHGGWTFEKSYFRSYGWLKRGKKCLGVQGTMSKKMGSFVVPESCSYLPLSDQKWYWTEDLK